MSISERLREIFPTKGHSIFFLVYVLLYIFNGSYAHCLSIMRVSPHTSIPHLLAHL